MKSFTNMKLEEYIRISAFTKSYKNDLVVIKMDGEQHELFDFDDETPFSVDALSFTLICRGKMDITIDYIPYQLKENMILDIIELHIVQNLKISPDFLGYKVFISRDFLTECMGNNKTLPSDVILSKRYKPTQQLKAPEMDHLVGIVKRMVYYMEVKDHIFQHNLLSNEFSSFMMEMANFMYHQYTNNQPPVELDHKGKTISEFFRLLSTHCKEEHEVSFYARQLCITPEYLSRILKKATEKTVNKWISNALMVEAKVLLRNHELSIQQIADMLHFSDQSSFGKFFKKHRGVSPLEYRKKFVSSPS